MRAFIIKIAITLGPWHAAITIGTLQYDWHRLGRQKTPGGKTSLGLAAEVETTADTCLVAALLLNNSTPC